MEGFKRGIERENHIHSPAEVRRAVLWLDITLEILYPFFLS